jgi:hypothetical protein
MLLIQLQNNLVEVSADEIGVKGKLK